MPPADLNTLPLPVLFDQLASLGQLSRFLELVRDEDLGPDRLDVTSELAVGAKETMRAEIRAREPGVISGLAALNPIVRAFDAVARLDLLAADGQPVEPGQPVAALEGLARDILAIERPMLNLLGRLSGIATRTTQFVQAAGDDWPARVFDTRKTTPGLRHLEKYAVRCGRGHCHRLGLDDAVLVKDNHLATIADDPMWPLRVHEWSLEARRRFAGRLRFFEVEVDTLSQFTLLMAVPEGAIDVVLLDNMPTADMREAVKERDKRHPEWLLEASGGVTLERIGLIASTGVDRISVGSLTHHAVSIDFGLDAV
jgi:nicotinate-nucleotide pyrophosphorylase (carboxylating)